VTRTYGTYAYLATGISDGTRHPDNAKPKWSLTLEPAVAIRAKRLFARARSYVSGRVVVNATPETARDLAWFLERFPLLPENEKSERVLREHAAEHERIEQQVGEVLAGTHQLPPLTIEPARPARDYQRAAVDLLRTTRSLLLTDEVGLGKTFTGLLALAHDDALPAVIVPPTHLPSRWVAELQDSFPTLRFDIAKTTKVTPAFEGGDRPDVLIVPYSRLAGWAHHLQGWARTVIFDEVQDLRRGTDSLKGSAAKMIADAATYRLGLTATPVYNYGGEIWQLFNILAPGVLGTYDEFAREWGGTWGRHSTVKQPAILGNYLREQGIMLGRTRQEVGRELPKTIKVPQFIDADPKALEAVAGDAAAMARLILDDTASRQEKFRAAGELDWKLREATGIAKAPYVAEFVRLILEAEGKVVLFGWHRAVYDVWNEMLAEYNPVMYTGSESPKQKDEAQDAFVNGDARVLIMSLRSGAGVDGLQLASNVAVFGELDWSPQVHEQAIGRLRRDGMGEAPPVAYFLNSVEGSDPALMEALQVKRNQAEPLVSRDGKLLANAVQDTTRARALAEQVLAVVSKRADDRGQLSIEAVA
jgi:superfamily II DNA or RNA helicase